MKEYKELTWEERWDWFGQNKYGRDKYPTDGLYYCMFCNNLGGGTITSFKTEDELLAHKDVCKYSPAHCF